MGVKTKVSLRVRFWSINAVHHRTERSAAEMPMALISFMTSCSAGRLTDSPVARDNPGGSNGQCGLEQDTARLPFRAGPAGILTDTASDPTP